MAVHVSEFVVLADTRITASAPDANNGGLATTLAVQGDGTESTIAALEKWDLTVPDVGGATRRASPSSDGTRREGSSRCPRRLTTRKMPG